MDDYEASDSEYDYSDDEKLLLEDARNALKNKQAEGDDEVYGFEDDEDEEVEERDEEMEEGEEGNEEDDDDAIDMGSDLEDQERTRDERAWGKKKQWFYGTNHVDQDYEGAYEGREVLEAEFEEEEARKIQKRLVEQLDEDDFTLADIIDTVETAGETPAKDELIKSDLSQLTKRQKLDVLQKESPEFFVLIEDFKNKLGEIQKKLIPILNLVKEKKIKPSPAVDFVKTKMQLILNYCINIIFYVSLKTRRVTIKNHPVMKSLFNYRQLLKQMEPVDEEVISPQINALWEKFYSGKEIDLKKTSKVAKKKMLKLLAKPEPKKKSVKFQDENPVEAEDEEEDNRNGNNLDHTQEKRSITWEMAKNKGLTPRRPKEQRNPRVKYRNKFRKAKVRRRGQVRLARSEIPVYGGERTGIKIGVSKSIKLK